MTELLKNRSIHRHIYLDLKRKITTGEFRYMDQIPTLPGLCELYGVSEAPIRRALDELSRNGMIEKRRGRGKGTVVIKRLVPTTVRVLLFLDDVTNKSQIEACHEVFDLLAGIKEAAQERGCRVQMVSLDSFDSLPAADQSTGYLIIGFSSDDYRKGVDLAGRHGAPAVGLDTPGSGYVSSSVGVDIRAGAFEAVAYLAKLGHRHIAYVGGTRSAWLAPRLVGYRQALEAHGQPFRPDLVCETSGIDSVEDAAALNLMLAAAPKPTAIFAASDYRALHLLDACRRIGLQVPDDVSICGYDDIGEAAVVLPGLTTVHHPRRELARAAVDHLYEMIHTKRSPSDIVIQPCLVVRESCAPPVGVL